MTQNFYYCPFIPKEFGFDSEKYIAESQRITAKKSACFRYKDVFFILDLSVDCIHLSYITGDFTFRMQKILEFCKLCAKIYGAKNISFCSQTKISAMIGKRLGFSPYSNSVYKLKVA